MLIFLIEIICWAPWISQFRALSCLPFFLGHSLEIDFYEILSHTGSFFLSDPNFLQTLWYSMYAQQKARSILFYNIAKAAVVFYGNAGNSLRYTLIHLYSGYYFSLKNSLFNVF